MAASRARVIVGVPARVRDDLLTLAGRTGADDLMLTTLLPDPVARRRSYRLVAEALGLGGSSQGDEVLSASAAHSGG